MKQKNSWWGFVAIIIGIFFLWIYQIPWGGELAHYTDTDITPDLVVESQPAGTFFIVKRATVPTGGFIVAHQDLGGRPGVVLGSSSYLSKGVNTSMAVVLNEPTFVGQSILVTLFADNGDYQLSEGDQPMVDAAGKTITKQVVIVNQDLLSGQ